ncbi:MAG: protein O-mannosyl-transferase family, partial [Planctomycetota bacterium]
MRRGTDEPLIRYSLFAIRHSAYVPLAAGIVALGVCLLTLRREVGLGDEAELALQAYQLGVTHPPGYPVHTFLGKLLNLAVTEPALATNLLSALCTSIAVGFLSAIVLDLTRHRMAGMLAPLVFALLPTVWRAAVTTEVYNVNICIIAAALWSAMRWRARPSTSLLCVTSILLGVSLGSSLANLLLLPGF